MTDESKQKTKITKVSDKAEDKAAEKPVAPATKKLGANPKPAANASDKASDKPAAEPVKLKKRDTDEKRFILPVDIRRKRIFWALGIVFTFLLFFAILLAILLINMVNPPGFGATPAVLNVNFQASFYGPPEQMLERPTSIAISPSGEVYVADTGNARIVVFDKSGTVVRTIEEFAAAPDVTYDEPEVGEGQVDGSASAYSTPLVGYPTTFAAPTSLAFASDGHWFVIDQTTGMVMFFNAHDQLIRGIVIDEEQPIDVSVNEVAGTEQLFITTRSGVLQADLNGTFRHAVINWGFQSGQFDNPAAVVVFDPELMSPEASLSATDTAWLTIVADTLNNRVQAFRNFDTAPEVAWMYGSPIMDPVTEAEIDYEFTNMTPSTLSAPVDLALSPLGRVFVVDALSSEVVVLNAQTGAYEYTISSIGQRDGLLFYPSGIDYYDGQIYVVDRFNDRVSIFDDAPPRAVEEVEVPAEAPNRWLMLFIPLAALALVLLRLLTLRMPRYVLDLSFLENLQEDNELLFFVVDYFDRLTLVSGTEAVAEKMIPGFDWKVETAKEAKRDTLIEQYPGLSDLEAEALTLVLHKKKRRSYLLTASPPCERAANDLNLKVLRFAEFRDLASDYIEEERAARAAEKAKAAEKAAKKAAKGRKIKEDTI